MGGDGVGLKLEVVSALQQGEQSALTVLLGNILDDPGQFGITGGGDVHPAQRVAFMGVKAGRDQDEVRLKRKAVLYSASPEPGGKGTLMV